MELHVTEARIYKDLNDTIKAKVGPSVLDLTRQSSLTACKMASTSIYVDPLTQADIDMLSGIVYVPFHFIHSFCRVISMTSTQPILSSTRVLMHSARWRTHVSTTVWNTWCWWRCWREMYILLTQGDSWVGAGDPGYSPEPSYRGSLEQGYGDSQGDFRRISQPGFVCL